MKAFVKEEEKAAAGRLKQIKKESAELEKLKKIRSDAYLTAAQIEKISTAKVINDKKSSEEEYTSFLAKDIVIAQTQTFDKQQFENNERYENNVSKYKDMLDNNLISQNEYDAKVKQAQKDSAYESAKILKKQRLFEITINTLAATVSFLATSQYDKAIAAGINGAFAFTLAAATPIPKYEKGGEILGKSHSAGGTLIEAEKGEFMLNKNSYSDSKEISNKINNGQLTDASFNEMKNDLQILNALNENGKIGNETNLLLRNLGISYIYKNYLHVKNADGRISKERLRGD